MRKLNRTRTLVAVLAVGAAGLVASEDVTGLWNPSDKGILHPMPPLGDIDCCHVAKITAEDDWETPVAVRLPQQAIEP